MSDNKRHPCQTCQGRKVIDGFCEVSPEWQGPDNEDGMICAADEVCPTCGGSGIERDK